MLRRNSCKRLINFPARSFRNRSKQSGPEVEPEIAATKAASGTEINFESSQPPLYYALASV